MRQLILPLVLLVLFLIASLASKAQTGIRLGAFGMPNAAVMLNEQDLDRLDPGNYTMRALPGMAGGFSFGINPTQIFGIRFDMIYGQQGVRFLERDLVNGNSTARFRGEPYRTTRYTNRLEYVKLPVMIGLQTNGEYRKVVASLYGGFQTSFLTRARMYNDRTDFSVIPPDYITDYPDDYARYTTLLYSIVGDAGVDIKLLDNLALNLRLRGEYSLGDAENKAANYRITQGGQTSTQSFWPESRGETNHLATGLLIGITFLPGK